MRAMLLTAVRRPLQWRELELAPPAADEVRLRVAACGVCRTDLHLADGELPAVRPPLILGHQIVGTVEALGSAARAAGFATGDRLGVPWLGGTDGDCRYCRAGQENLCDAAEFTGYTRPGGYATLVNARAAYCLRLPADGDPVALAPLLCAGLIGWRALRMAGDGETLGLYGFGAAAHLVAQVAMRQGRRIYAFTRPGDRRAQDFAGHLGAAWAGDSTTPSPEPLDAAIVFAPDGALVPLALAAVRKGGTVVCGGIHMSDIPSFPYRLLWEERRLLSVANLTRDDAQSFAALIADRPLAVTTRAYPLEGANEALDDLRHGRFDGAAVLIC